MAVTGPRVAALRGVTYPAFMSGATGENGSVPLALIQMACGDDPVANLERALTRVEEAARSGARLVCLADLVKRFRD